MKSAPRRNVKRDRTHLVANPARHQAMLEMRSSSAAEPHKDRRTRRARSRSASEAKAIAFASWRYTTTHEVMI